MNVRRVNMCHSLALAVNIYARITCRDDDVSVSRTPAKIDWKTLSQRIGHADVADKVADQGGIGNAAAMAYF